MNKLTRNEVFDIMEAHLLKQMKCSRLAHKDYEGNSCAYRGAGGLKCAVGSLIKDEVYTPELEQKNANHAEVLRALALSGVPTDEDSIEMMLKVQSTHDRIDPEEWESCLGNLRNWHRSRGVLV